MWAAVKLLVSKPLRLKEDWKITFKEDGNYQAQGGEYLPDWQGLCISYRAELMELSELDLIIQTIIQDSNTNQMLFGGVPDAEQQRFVFVTRYLVTFLREYLEATQDRVLRTGGPIFDIDVFESVYGKLEEYLYSIEWFDSVWHIHFRNLAIEDDRVELEEGLYLRKATQEEREEAVKDAVAREIPHHIPEAFLEIHTRMDRGGPFRTAEAQLKAEKIWRNVLFALRLVNSSSISYESARWVTVNQPFEMMSGVKAKAPPSFTLNERYILTQSNASELKAIWPRVKRRLEVIEAHKEKKIEESKLSIALTRWDDS